MSIPGKDFITPLMRKFDARLCRFLGAVPWCLEFVVLPQWVAQPLFGIIIFLQRIKTAKQYNWIPTYAVLYCIILYQIIFRYICVALQQFTQQFTRKFVTGFIFNQSELYRALILQFRYRCRRMLKSDISRPEVILSTLFLSLLVLSQTNFLRAQEEKQNPRRGQGVDERSRKEFDAVGIRAGGFIV
jgi:hypothetical protein